MSALADACQRALYTRLKGSISAVGNRVYDDPPQSVTFPWLEIGDRQIIPDDATSATILGGSDDGVEDFFDLHIWSRGSPPAPGKPAKKSGKQECNEIIDALHGLLHQQTLSIVGRTSGNCWITNVRAFRDPDAITRHGIVTVKIIHRTQ